MKVSVYYPVDKAAFVFEAKSHRLVEGQFATWNEFTLEDGSLRSFSSDIRYEIEQ